jgi:DNA processing protein
MDERLYWLGFSFFHGIGPAKFRLLLEKFWTAENAWNATELELKHSGIGEKLTEKFLAFRKKFDPQDYARQLQKENVRYLIQTDEKYPRLLNQIDSAPLVLYVRGDPELLYQTEDKKYIAVVGTRKITEYGRQVTETLTDALAASGCVIVSGLAMGVDAVAHAATLRVKGKTIAVLGCGVDCCTPRENQRLYDQIIEDGGAIVSEAPLGHTSFVGSFPARNRIIAGLSEGVLVTEGAEDSGSLITANDALKNNRMVFAVPGPITSAVSRGPISLISKGAKMVTTAQDVLNAIGLAPVNREKILAQGDTPEEQKVLDLLLSQRLQFDEIVRKLGMHTSQVGILLSLMEMKGYIKRSDQEGYGLAEI